MKIICPDGNGYSYYVQAVDTSRYTRAGGVETFLVKAGDYWNGPDGSDALNFRERCEARVTTEDAVGSTHTYAFHLKIPTDYAEFSPKQTLGQWHNGVYDSVYNRYENGEFLICLNNHDSDSFVDYPVVITKGVWNTFRYTFTWHPTNGAVTAVVNGKTVVKAGGLSLVPADASSVYFKYGIYRNMTKGLIAPDQQASYRLVSRA
ncbi:heparin lyase I family protein [Rhizobium glycinendophyticum]|uniref:Polysaccharide lyase family 7 protein n=1 Tax=Rhizobium glycinendophyticum TaxID=2589807 RepID=A0A504UUM4_9HYPH|nr:heparin lyase I family protein [Rhizobium glycinendophyticum]TPP10441.1 hypothetical protein FJQ55_06220 [Rhizobium glycinendophyticum]